MTEEAWHIAAKYAVGINECAREIDALTEQRAAAAVREERERCAQIADHSAEIYRALPVLGGFPKDRKDVADAIAYRIRAVADHPAPERWRHKKRGATYTVLGRGDMQALMPIPDGHEVTIYRADSDGSLWVRPTAEFYDGRFERMPPTDAGGPGSASNMGAVAPPGPTAGDVERADAWLQTNLGETARAELLAQIRELEQAALEAVRFAHGWIGGLPLTPSFEDKRAAQEALERAEIRVRVLADKLTESK